MPIINVRDTESFDVALRRFKRACEKAGIPTRLRQLEFYEKPTAKRKRKKAAAVKRFQKKLQKEFETPATRGESGARGSASTRQPRKHYGSMDER